MSADSTAPLPGIRGTTVSAAETPPTPKLRRAKKVKPEDISEDAWMETPQALDHWSNEKYARFRKTLAPSLLHFKIPEDLAKYNELLAKAVPTGAPRCLLQTEPFIPQPDGGYTTLVLMTPIRYRRIV